MAFLFAEDFELLTLEPERAILIRSCMMMTLRLNGISGVFSIFLTI